MARILLIGPPWGDVYGNFKHVAKVGVFYPPLGLCYLKSPLQADGHQVKVVDGEASGFSLNDILGVVRDYKPDIIGIQIVSPLWLTAVAIATAVKEQFQNIVCVAGGPHMTLTREEAQKQAMQAVRALRYDQGDYFWINDLTPRMIMHPTNARLEGQDLSDHKDPDGKALFNEMVRVARADGAGLVEHTVDRERLWCAATPQMFRYAVLLHALQQARASTAAIVTDEAEAVERSGHPVRLVPGRADNLKITFPEDLELAALLLRTSS